MNSSGFVHFVAHVGRERENERVKKLLENMFNYLNGKFMQM